VTVTAQDTVFTHTGNGVSTTFAYGCLVLDDDDLVVLVDGEEQLSGYSVSGIGSPSGGSVTFSSAPANGASVILQRKLSLKRETDYQQFGDWKATVVNPDFDRLWMANQQQQEELDRSPKLALGTSGIDPTLPAAVAGRGIKWNSGGTGFVNTDNDPDQIAAVAKGYRDTAGGYASAAAGSASDAAGSASSAAEALADLNANTGSGLVGFLQDGSGAAQRTAQDKLRESISVKDFGAVGNGIADDTSAFQKACAVGGRIFVPPGTYRVTGSAIIKNSGTVLYGAGPASMISMEALDAPVFIVGDPSNGSNAPSGVQFSGLYFVQTQTQVDINGAGPFGLDKYKTAAAILHGRGDWLSVENCSFVNFVMGVSYYGNADNEAAGIATGFRVVGCRFDGCNFGVWVNGCKKLRFLDNVGNNTVQVQISGGSLLPPHLLYGINYGIQDQDWQIANVIDANNPYASSIKIKYATNVNISNVQARSCAESVALYAVNNFSVTGVISDSSPDNGLATQGTISLYGCQNGTITGGSLVIDDQCHGVLCSTLDAANSYTGALLKTSDVLISGVNVDYRQTPGDEDQPFYLIDTDRVTIVSPVFKRATGLSQFLIYLKNVAGGGQDNAIVNPVVQNIAGDTFNYRTIFTDTGFTNTRIQLCKASFTDVAPTTNNPVGGSGTVIVSWDYLAGVLSFTPQIKASSGRSWSTLSTHLALWENSGAGLVDIVTGNTAVGSYRFSDSDAGGVGQVQYDHSTNEMSLVTNSSNRLYLSASGIDFNTGGRQKFIDSNGNHALRTYTVATLPTATAQRLIYVSDGTGNKRLAVSDGTNWRWPDGAIVS
jgi:hypothetical protein